jgi:hypothetical protein
MIKYLITVLILYLVTGRLPMVQAQSNENMKVLFIHHSTGGNLIKQGDLRGELKKIAPNIEFWDHSYNLFPVLPKLVALFTNYTGLSDAQGKMTGKQHDIVLSNNSPKEYAEIFARDPNDPTLKAILNYDVIAFKNCFPTTKITSDEQLEEYKTYYTKIKESVSKYPNKKFILLTPPPLRKEVTTSDNAKRAQELANWLNSDQIIKNQGNLFVFDFFQLLSDDYGYLKPEYTPLIWIDSHPNKKANKTIAPIFAKFIVEIANK